MKRKHLGSLSALVSYDSSDSDEAEASEPKKRLPTPNLPPGKEYRCITRRPHSDVSSEMRIRNFPHEPGNWATYIYYPVDRTDDLLEYLNDLPYYFPDVKLNATEDFHISVTKTVILRHHWIKDFTDSVNEVLVDIDPFLINLSGLKIYVNENKTRTFIALRVEEGSKDLCDIVQLIDKCLDNYNLPTFHNPASFHMSMLWCAGDKAEELQQCLKSLPDSLADFSFCCKIPYLRCKCGNKTFTFSFSG